MRLWVTTLCFAFSSLNLNAQSSLDKLAHRTMGRRPGRFHRRWRRRS